MTILCQEGCSVKERLMIWRPSGKQSPYLAKPYDFSSGHNVISALGNVISALGNVTPALGNVIPSALGNVIAVECWIQTQQGFQLLTVLCLCVCSCFVLGQLL